MYMQFLITDIMMDFGLHTTSLITCHKLDLRIYEDFSIYLNLIYLPLLWIVGDYGTKNLTPF